VILLPLIALSIIAARTRRQFVVAVVTHLVSVALLINSDFFVDSKERILLVVLFPYLSVILFNSGLRLNVRLFLVAVFLGFVFWISSDVVDNSRGIKRDEFYTRTEADSRLLASIGRLAVIDAAGAAIENEFSGNPMRPTWPSWAVFGAFVQLLPASFERPNHAREALSLTGYLTSTDEVNIAMTVPAHLIWSFGPVLAILVLAGYLYLFRSMLRSSESMHPTLRSLFVLSICAQTARLEALANVYFGGILFAFLVYFTASKIVTSLRDR
jgi:hypothetical protein